jgi:hypothetical protein
MAYVRKTQTLMSEVAQRIKTMRANELKVVAEDKIEIGSPEHASFRTAVDTALWADAPHLKDPMPEKWCTLTTEIRFSFPESVNSMRMTLNVPDTQRLKLPPTISSYHTVQLKQEHLDDVILAWVSQADARAAQRRLIGDKYDTLEHQVVGFIDRFPSLNAALKEMPELEFYIPTQYLEKVHEPTEPRERVKKETVQDEMNIDVEALASMAIAHRITTAGL